jgi:hypothetical protein
VEVALDLSGHSAFKPAAQDRMSATPGARLLTAAWVALASGRVESVSLHLRHGPAVEGVTAIRVDGAIAEVSCSGSRRTEIFLAEDVVRVSQVPHGAAAR